MKAYKVVKLKDEIKSLEIQNNFFLANRRNNVEVFGNLEVVSVDKCELSILNRYLMQLM